MSAERLPYKIVRRESRMGRSKIWLVCPCCGSEVIAYVWSLSGSGKRCECGAMHGSLGTEPPTTTERDPR
jgi:hypothetical protein